jgi:hypothetical protein
MGAGGWLGMTGFGAGLNRTGWPNASCTGPRVNTWRFGSTCDARLEEVDALVGGIACVGAVPAVPAGAAGCWAVNSGPDGQATQATVRIEVASQLVTTTAVGNRVVFMVVPFSFSASNVEEAVRTLKRSTAIGEDRCRSQRAARFSFVGALPVCGAVRVSVRLSATGG